MPCWFPPTKYTKDSETTTMTKPTLKLILSHTLVALAMLLLTWAYLHPDQYPGAHNLDTYPIPTEAAHTQ